MARESEKPASILFFAKQFLMRLWTLHPRYLDAKGLVALWRESLLAQAVLRGQSRGYRHHPQLQRFQEHDSPRYAINSYLSVIHQEACERGYRFDRTKIGPTRDLYPIEATDGQVAYEWSHLSAKLQNRSPEVWERWQATTEIDCHRLFRVVPGPIASWERL